MIANKPNILEGLNTELSVPANAAIAPTIITDEIALVTDIKVYEVMVLHSKQHSNLQILIK